MNALRPRRNHRLQSPCRSPRLATSPALLAAPALFLAIASGVSPAAAEALRARGPAGDVVLVAATDPASPRVRTPLGDVELPLNARAAVSDLVHLGDGWLAVAVERAESGRRQLRLVRGDDEGAGLEPTPQTDAVLVRQPRLVVEAGQLRALLWLEGETIQTLSVRSAELDGGVWRAPVTVSPTGPGSQLALSVAVLPGGRRLAAWSAFDGADDEVVFSLWTDDKWSAPSGVSVDNAVPDIQPRLHTTGDGALLAWSRFDGRDYRLMTARFDGDAWSEARLVGPRGSTFPAFSAEAAPLVVYRVAIPDGWQIAELSANGEALRTATVDRPGDERPLLLAYDESEVVVDWPSADATKSVGKLRLPWR